MIITKMTCDLCDTDVVTGSGYRLEFDGARDRLRFSLRALTDRQASEKVICRACIEAVVAEHGRLRGP